MSHILEKHWTTKAGLQAVVLICLHGQRKSHRCGYVAVPSEHPTYGKSYNQEIDCISQEAVNNTTLGDKSPMLLLTASVINGEATDRVRRSLDCLIEVHGGITYDGESGKYPIETTEKLWWFGFDCQHCDDGHIEPDPAGYWNHGHVWTLEECEEQCESMAQQLQALCPTKYLATARPTTNTHLKSLKKGGSTI